MRLFYPGLIAIFSGFLLLLLGGSQAGIFIVFPFIISSSLPGMLGAILIFAGFVLIIMDAIPRELGFREIEYEPPKVEKRGIGIVLIGPIPLIIDSKNKKLSLISLAIFLTALLILLLLYLGALA